MNAIEFVKKFGIDYAIKVLNYDQSISDHVCQLDFGESENLKQIVEAFEFVSAHGSIDIAKKYISTMDTDGTSKHYDKLRTFINLVEQCQ